MILLIAAIALLTLSLCSVATESPFADLMVTKMSFYRAKANANPLVWDDRLADLADPQAVNCSLLYDYWLPEGQVIFRIGNEDGSYPNLSISSSFAIDHWWDMRANYTPRSEDYDELQPFYWSWEFTQMVWDTNTKVGCAWSPIMCPTEGKSLPQVAQLVCLFTPGGNKWDQFGAHVHCPDCHEEPQTSTVNTAILSWNTEPVAGASTAAGIKRDFDAEHWQAEVDRVQAYQTMALSVFIPGFTPSPVAERTTVATTQPIARSRLVERAEPPSAGDTDWQDAYLGAVNKWRARHDVESTLQIDTGLVSSLSNEYLKECVWPQSQNIEDERSMEWNHAFWLTDENTLDYYQQFDHALHMWEVWGNGSTYVGSLWANWYTVLTKGETMKIACGWTPKCDQTTPPSYMMICLATPKIAPSSL